MNTTRRSFITGIIGVLAAPSIVRISSIMPVKSFIPSWVRPGAQLDIDFVNDRAFYNGYISNIATWIKYLNNNTLSKLTE